MAIGINKPQQGPVSFPKSKKQLEVDSISKNDPPLPNQRVVGYVAKDGEAFAGPHVPVEQQPVLWPPDPKHPERSGNPAAVQARIELDTNVGTLTNYLKEANDQHHVVEQKMGVPDEKWPEWYASWLSKNNVTGLRGDVAELTKDLRTADQAIKADAWHKPYAAYLVLKDAAVHGGLEKMLSQHDVIPEPKTGWTRVGEPIVKTDQASAFGSKITTELFWSPEHGIGVKHSRPVESGYGGEEQQTFFYRFD